MSYDAVASESAGARHAVPVLTFDVGLPEALTQTEKSQNHHGRCPGTFPTDAFVIAVQFAVGTTCAAAAGVEQVFVLLAARITTAATVTATAAPTPTAVAPATPSPPAAPPAPPTLVVVVISVTVTGVAGTGGVGAALNCTLEDSPAPTITHGPSIRR